MRVGEIESLVDGGSRIRVKFSCGMVREYGLSRVRRLLEQPKVGMGLAETETGRIMFFASLAVACCSLGVEPQ